MNKARCGDCDHFSPTQDKTGLCKLNPPVIVTKGGPYSGTEQKRPVLHEDDRCGQFRKGSSAK